MSVELALRNLPATASLAEVQACLGDFRPLSVEFNRDSITGKFKGTVFVRLDDLSVAQSLLQSGVLLDGRRIKVEESRRAVKSFSAPLISDSRRQLVHKLVEDFLSSASPSLDLPADFSAEERKLAHSLAEKFKLKHETVSTSDLRSVRLSRVAPPGLMLSARQRAWTVADLPTSSLRKEATVFTPASLLPVTQKVPEWLEERRPRTSFVVNEKLMSM